jgi:hypothetical protein
MLWSYMIRMLANLECSIIRFCISKWKICLDAVCWKYVSAGIDIGAPVTKPFLAYFSYFEKIK